MGSEERMDLAVGSGDPSMERPWASGAAEEVGGAWTSLCRDRYWSRSGSHLVGTPRRMGLM